MNRRPGLCLFKPHGVFSPGESIAAEDKAGDTDRHCLEAKKLEYSCSLYKEFTYMETSERPSSS